MIPVTPCNLTRAAAILIPFVWAAAAESLLANPRQDTQEIEMWYGVHRIDKGTKPSQPEGETTPKRELSVDAGCGSTEVPFPPSPAPRARPAENSETIPQTSSPQVEAKESKDSARPTLRHKEPAADLPMLDFSFVTFFAVAGSCALAIVSLAVFVLRRHTRPLASLERSDIPSATVGPYTVSCPAAGTAAQKDAPHTAKRENRFSDPPSESSDARSAATHNQGSASRLAPAVPERPRRLPDLPAEIMQTSMAASCDAKTELLELLKKEVYAKQQKESAARLEAVRREAAELEAVRREAAEREAARREAAERQRLAEKTRRLHEQNECVKQWQARKSAEDDGRSSQKLNAEEMEPTVCRLSREFSLFLGKNRR